MKIQILGSGCTKCKKMAEIAETTAKELQLNYELEKVSDINKIISFGVMMTPALAINGEVKIAGRLPSVDEIKKFLS
ncbi:MAG: thioredoxin family protein [Verrucomicrobiota bacterium]|nr:thioredoxin family protein [Verrucomicrobiota bacterium]